MIYHSNYSDDYLCSLILRGKSKGKKGKKLKGTQIESSYTFFKWSQQGFINQQDCSCIGQSSYDCPLIQFEKFLGNDIIENLENLDNIKDQV